MTIKDFNTNFLLGTQYYRPPTPPEKEWEDDFKHIKDLGMDFVKIWAMWTYLEREKGKFDWTKLDKLLELAEKYNLKVMINIVLDHIPYWAQIEASAWIIKPDGTKRSPTRIYGGDTACWDNLKLRELVTSFLKELVRRYRNSISLSSWDVWNEPDNFECYCKYTIEKYINWLKSKFSSIEELNECLGEAYSSWEEIQPPTHQEMITPYIFYTKFRMESLAEQIRWIYSIVKTEDPNHPVITHSHSWGTPNVDLGVARLGAGWDDWLLAKEVDYYGTSLHSMYYESQHRNPKDFIRTIVNLETKRSITKGEYIVSELTSGITRHKNMNVPIKEKEMLYNLWLCVAHNAKGIIMWQFKPERYTVEAGGCGLINMDGTENYRTEEFKAFVKTFKENEDIFTNLKHIKSKVGIFYSMHSSIVASVNKMLNYQDAFHGASYMLWMSNIVFDIIRSGDNLEDYSFIYLPMPICISQNGAKDLLRFVERGGILISEAGLCSYEENGFFSVKVPGYGFSEVAGVLEREIIPEDGTLKIRTNFGDIYALGEKRTIEFLKDYEIIGEFEDRKPAIIGCKHGLGKIIYILTYPSLFYEKTGDIESLKIINKLFGLEPEVIVEPQTGVTCRILYTLDNRRILFIFNNIEKDNENYITLKDKFRKIHPIFKNFSDIEITSFDSIKVHMGPKEVLVLELL